jgi:hypothetical protein
MRKLIVIASLAVAAAVLILGRGVSEAQYPEVVGSVTLTVSSTTASAGQDVTLSCQLRNASGAAVSGADCVFTVQSEPGNDASVNGAKSAGSRTGADGRATAGLHVGSTAGFIVVNAEAGGLRSTVLVSVVAGAFSAPPPAAPVTSITPPQTGDGGLKP